MTRERIYRWIGWAAVATALAAIVATVSAWGFRAPPPPQHVMVPESREEISLSFAPVVRRAIPAVVNIHTTTFIEHRRHPFAGDPYFEQFFSDLFGRGLTERGAQTSLGSGVIVRPDGIIVTNAHVIAGADQITVALADRREFEARVLLMDDTLDLAVLRVDGTGLPHLEFRNSDTLEVGDLVLAIGNPFGVGQTVTSGIISAGARSNGEGRIFIQTDAAINPGNSGGALLDMSGRLAGVNTAILTRSGGSNGIGFAIPATVARRAVDAALRGAPRVAHVWLGAEVQPVSADLAEALGLSRPSGLLLTALHPKSPFAQAGLEVGDVILRVGEASVNDRASLRYRLDAIGENRAMIAYRRDGMETLTTLDLIPPPEDPPRNISAIAGRGLLSGLVIANLNPAFNEEAGFPATETGVVVVQGGRGPAARLGLQRGDVLLELNGKRIARVADVEALLDRAPRVSRLAIRRDGRALTLLLDG